MVDGCIWLYIGVAEHSPDITCIYFNYEIADANDIEVLHLEHVEEAI